MDNFQTLLNFPRPQNRFRHALDNGEFVLLIESEAPGFDQDPTASANQLAELENTVLGFKGLNTALAITDQCDSESSLRAIECANMLSPENRDQHVIYLSGRNTTRAEIPNLISVATNSGSFNLVPTSGNTRPGETIRDCRKSLFTESISTLQELNQKPTFFTGATVNPFQYTGYSLIGQYSKLVKKLNAGASFIITQAGWDMLKLQSLCWYLNGRSLFYPMIARLILLSPSEAEQILSGNRPGIQVSHGFKHILEKELSGSTPQFEAAQYRRLELQAAGCKLLGFSGIQLAGVANPTKAKIAVERIAHAFQEFPDFDSWLESYNSNEAQTDMAPDSTSFCLYDRVLKRPYPTPSPDSNDTIEHPIANELEPIQVSVAEKIGYQLRSLLFVNSDQQPADHQQLFKKLFASCRSCDICRLSKTSFICPEICPKGLANGPCGGVKPDGICEIGNNECVYCKMVRIAQWTHKLNHLEDYILPQGKTNKPPKPKKINN